MYRALSGYKTTTTCEMLCRLLAKSVYYFMVSLLFHCHDVAR